MRICCEWLCCEPFLEEYPVSTKPSRDLLCSQNVWGLWQFYLDRYQPSCSLHSRPVHKKLDDVDFENIAMLLLDSIPTYVSTQGYHMLQLLQPPTLVDWFTKSVAIWITATTASTATCVEIIAEWRVLANRIFFKLLLPILSNYKRTGQ